MPQVLIRDVPAATIDTLKARAERNRRSLQAELLRILEREAGWDVHVEAARQIRAMSGKVPGNSADLIREDRDR